MTLLCGARPAQAEPRFALVIGNSNYQVGRLANPKNDARLIASTLHQLGFRVTTLIDATQSRMKRAMLTFSRKLRNSDAIGLFYYAGHGVQVDGENYLIPVDANIVDESEVPVEGLSLNQLFKTMKRGAARVNIAILDACRNNPFASAARGGKNGLAPVLAPSGSFIAFATAPGKLAYDGKDGNSPYSKALAAAMLSPGITIEEVFRRTRRAVLAATKGRQTPWENTSLTGEFFFKQKPAALEANRPLSGGSAAGGAGGAVAAVLSPRQLAELKAWRRLQQNKSDAGYRAFIKDYPDGLFVELARIKLAHGKLASLNGDSGGAEARGNPSAGFDADQNSRWTTYLPALAHAGNDTGPAARKIRAAGLVQQADAALAGKDFAKAVQLYRQAAKLAAPEAMYHLAKLYDKGHGVRRSLELSASWYRAAAEQGHAPSMAALGNMYEFGDGVERSLAEALRYYKMAADRGHGNGMTSLAFLYATGKGVARDRALARHWYRAGAEKGNTRAMFNLALMEIRGEGGAVDFDDAAQWLKSAVAKGHSGAMRQLAALYELGRGVRRAPWKSAQLLLRSLKEGNADTRNDLFVRPETWSRATRRQVQRGLRRKGVYRGPATGYIGRRTRKALRTYIAKK